MNSQIEQRLNDLKIDDLVWYVYIFIVIAALFSNKIEKEFVITGDEKKEKEFHAVNLVVLTIAFSIYVFFLFRSYRFYKESKDPRATINLIATILLLVAGGTFLWLELQSADDENNELGI